MLCETFRVRWDTQEVLRKREVTWLVLGEGWSLEAFEEGGPEGTNQTSRTGRAIITRKIGMM